MGWLRGSRVGGAWEEDGKHSVYNSSHPFCLKLGLFFSLTLSAWIFEFVGPVV